MNILYVLILPATLFLSSCSFLEDTFGTYRFGANPSQSPGWEMPASGLMAYYTFTGNANDQSGNGLTGTVNNSAVLTNDRFGRAGCAYDMAGGFIAVSNANQAALEPTSGITISCFILRNGSLITGYQYCLIRKAGDMDAGYALYLGDTGLGLFFTEPSLSSETNLIYPAALNDGVWHHIAATYSSASGIACLYLDGVLVTNTALPYSFSNSGNILSIGSNGYIYSGSSFPGFIDNVSIYNRALSASDVLALSQDTN